MNPRAAKSRRSILLAAALLLPAGCRNPGGRAHRPPGGEPEAVFNLPAPNGIAARPENPSPLTEKELVAMVLARDPGLEAARAELETARERRRAALLPDDPELRAGVGRDRRGRIRDDERLTETYGNYEIGLRFFPPHPWRNSAVRRQADAEIEIARSRLAIMERRTALAVRSDFLRLREAEAELEFLDRLLELRRNRYRALREKVERGEATAGELARAAAGRLETLRESRIQASEIGRLRRSLAGRAGLAELGPIADPQDSSRRRVEAITNRIVAGEPAAEKDKTPERPEIELLRWHERAAAAELRAARAELVPWLSHLQVSFQDDDRSRRNDEWSFRAGVNLPLFSLARRPDRVESAGWRAARARLHESLEIIRAEAEEARAAWLDAVDSHTEFRQSCEPLLDEIRRDLEIIQTRPEIEILAVLRLKESLLETERLLARSRFEVERAALELDAARGTDSW